MSSNSSKKHFQFRIHPYSDEMNEWIERTLSLVWLHNLVITVVRWLIIVVIDICLKCPALWLIISFCCSHTKRIEKNTITKNIWKANYMWLSLKPHVIYNFNYFECKAQKGNSSVTWMENIELYMGNECKRKPKHKIINYNFEPQFYFADINDSSSSIVNQADTKKIEKIIEWRSFHLSNQGNWTNCYRFVSIVCTGNINLEKNKIKWGNGTDGILAIYPKRIKQHSSNRIR